MCSSRASYALVLGLCWTGCAPAEPATRKDLASHTDLAQQKTVAAAPSLPSAVEPSSPPAILPPPVVETSTPVEAPPSPTPPVSPQGELVLYDFSGNQFLSWSEPPQEERDRLLARFPHPHAAAGAHCDPNAPGTPAAQRMGGILLPRVTMVQGAFTRAGASQTAYFIDYCPSGVGVPRTRRIIVLQGDALALDHELAGDLQADEVLRAVDVDGDGLAELLLTVSMYNPQTTQTTTGAILYRLQGGAPRVMGRWTGIAHCYSGHDDRMVSRIKYRRNGKAVSFRAESSKEHCYYPPAPPPPH